MQFGNDEELTLRLRVQYLEDRNKYLMETMSRLVKYAYVPDGAASKDYSAKETRGIAVPARALATVIGELRKEGYRNF